MANKAGLPLFPNEGRAESVPSRTFTSDKRMPSIVVAMRQAITRAKENELVPSVHRANDIAHNVSTKGG